MVLDKDTLRELRPLIESARRELADMVSGDVPVSMRRVVKSSARTLTPPYARSVIDELTKNEGFREAVSDRYGSEDPVDNDLVAFLDDPEDGIKRLEARAEATKHLETVSNLESANKEIKSQKKSLAEAKKLLKEERDKCISEVENARESVSADHRRALERNKELQSEVADKDSKIEELNKEKAELRDNLRESEGKRKKLTERHRKSAEAEVREAPLSGSDPAPSDGLEYAKWLDRVERNARPNRSRRSSETGWVVTDTVCKLSAPAGVPGDSVELLKSLIEQVPKRFIIDGYNVGGVKHGAKGFGSREAREAARRDAIKRSEQLRRKSVSDVVVVFDSPEDESDYPDRRTSVGVSVMFSRGPSADDVIVDVVGDGPSRTVVITNDRELRTRVESKGAISLPSDVFIKWSSHGQFRN